MLFPIILVETRGEFFIFLLSFFEKKRIELNSILIG